MRENLTTVAELAGGACIAIGCALIAPSLGWIAAGAGIIAASYMAARPPRGGNA